jgi:peptide/nickel transport system substrate-binding protein
MSKKWCEENDTVDVAEFKTAKENYATRHANGTGPFMLESREPQVKTLMVPFPNWWDKRVDNVTEANFTVIKSDATRIASLLSGFDVQRWMFDVHPSLQPLTAEAG